MLSAVSSSIVSKVRTRQTSALDNDAIVINIAGNIHMRPNIVIRDDNNETIKVAMTTTYISKTYLLSIIYSILAF